MYFIHQFEQLILVTHHFLANMLKAMLPQWSDLMNFMVFEQHNIICIALL